MTEGSESTTLVLGFGNPAREDDGLGPAAAERIAALAIGGVTVDSDYQLTVEDAADAARYGRVVFVDAAADGVEPFTFSRVEGKSEMTLSSHSVSPEGVVGLAGELFGARPEAYLLGIRGYSFEMFTERMTDRAVENLEKAVDFLSRYLGEQ